MTKETATTDKRTHFSCKVSRSRCSERAKGQQKCMKRIIEVFFHLMKRHISIEKKVWFLVNMTIPFMKGKLIDSNKLRGSVN